MNFKDEKREYFLKGLSLHFNEEFRIYSDKDFSKPKNAIEAVGKHLATRDSEMGIAIALNSAGEPLCLLHMGVGSESGFSFSVSTVLRQIMLTGAWGFILIHNHPNHNLTPSPADTATTNAFIEGAKALKLAFVDDMIVTMKNGKLRYYSSRYHGRLRFKETLTNKISPFAKEKPFQSMTDLFEITNDVVLLDKKGDFPAMHISHDEQDFLNFINNGREVFDETKENGEDIELG